MTLEEALFSRSLVIASDKQSAMSAEKQAEFGNAPNSF